MSIETSREKLRTIALVASVPTLLHALYSVAIDRRGFESQLSEVAFPRRTEPP